ncbi:MAG TPA: PAS domain S-box protein [Pirellulaceae bacterium]|jgi:PAS domain S-box-containing protein|nr:PAS domain S-box protein [Pirellulaceae bacterium]
MKQLSFPGMGYAVAVGASLLALLARLAMSPAFGEAAPLMLLAPAVVTAAWVGGFRPGLLATLLCTVIGTYFFMAPPDSLLITELEDWTRIVVFVTEGLLFSWLFERIRRKRSGLETEVTERRRSEEDLKAQKELLRTTLTSVGDGMIATDAEGRVTFLNPVAEKLTGWSDADARGVPLTTVFNIVNEATGAVVENPAIRALREGTIVGLANHTLLISKDGSVRPIDDSAAPIRNGDGAPRGAVLVFRDVTEQKQAREDLRRSEERLRTIVEATPECVKVVGADGNLLLMNAAGLRMIEAEDFESVSGACVYNLIADEHRQAWSDFNARVCAGAAERFEFDVVGLKGSRRHMETHAVPVQMPDGATAHLAVTRDMTERKRAEARLRESEERYRLIGEASHDAIWDWNLITNEVVWNPGVCSLFGYSEEQVGKTGDWWLERMHPDDQNRVSHGIHAVIDGATGTDDWTAEYRFRHADGGYVAVFDRGQVVRDAKGKATRMVGAMLDLTERDEAAAKLREAEERFDFVRRSSGVGFWYCDLPFDVLEWDETVKSHFHLPGDARVTIDTFYDRMHPDDRETTRQAIERSIGDRTPYDTDFRTVDAESSAELWIRAIGRTFYDPEGAPRRFDGVTVDVTESRRTQNELRRVAADLSEADRRKNEFLATLAHELRNPLAPIRSGLDLLKLVKDDPAEVDELRGVMERQTLQMVRLIDDLLEISRITQGKLELRRSRVPLAEVVQSAVESIRPFIEEAGHRLSISIPPEPIFVNADPARLAQVVSNLLNNAAKFTPDGGRIDLTVDPPGQQDGQARSVTLTVRDDGIGIPDEMRERIFDMFAQLEGGLERGSKGLGIGLTLVKKLVEMHDGKVEVQSAGGGKGTSFVVTLPLAEEAPPEPAPGRPTEAANEPAAKLRVLVVDDNRAAADMLGMIIRRLGDDVRIAYDGAEAIEAAAEFRPHLALMDLGMPRMNGYEAAMHIRRQPWGESMALAALTGWGQEEDRRRTAEAGFDHHLVKPAEPAEIRKILAEVKRNAL